MTTRPPSLRRRPAAPARRALVLCAALILAPAVVHAFQIGTPASEPCHERILLGALDVLPPPWSAADDADLEPLLARLTQRARDAGLPGDDASRAFVADLTRRYGLGHIEDPYRRAVVAALVLGVRGPDTGGFAIVKLNELRVRHIDDGRQGDHALRRSTDDGPEGVRAAVANGRAAVERRIDAATDRWRRGEGFARERWSFALYGDVAVRALGPAVRLGEAAHAVQDAYTHTLRDDELRVVTVLNFVDAVLDRDRESRDGLPHSDRLDRCDPGDDFDRLRIDAARAATAAVLAAADEGLSEDPSAADTALGAALDSVFALRPGCSADNGYCGSAWLKPALSEQTEPISIWVCSASPGRGAGDAPALLAGLLLLGALGRRARGARRG